MASNKSARSILTSSIISNSMFLMTDFFKPLILKCLTKVFLLSNLTKSEKLGAIKSGINPPKGN